MEDGKKAQSVPKTPSTEKEPLTLQGVIAKLKAKGLVPVRVEEGLSVERKGLRWPAFDFDGTLSEFLDTAVALNVKAIFVSASVLNEEDFTYELDPPRPTPNLSEHSEPPLPEALRKKLPDGFLETLAEPINLTSRQPRLKPFQKYIGQHFEYELFFSCADVFVQLRVREPWYEKFEDIRIKTIDSIVEERDDAITQQRDKATAESHKQEEELASLRASLKTFLLRDESFISRPFSYKMDHVRVKYPEVADKLGKNLIRFLQELDFELRDEMYERREAERLKEEEEDEKFEEECRKKIAKFKQTLPQDVELMSSRNKISMRTYLIDKHPELFDTLLSTKREQDDFINWLFLQKQRKRV